MIDTRAGLAGITLALCLMVGSCGEIGMIASPTTTFSTTDALTLKRPATDFFDKSTVVGKSLGYDVSAINRTDNQISFTKDAGLGVGVLVGKIQHSDIDLKLSRNMRTIDIRIQNMGNFGTGGQQEATSTVDRFKERLSSAFQ